MPPDAMAPMASSECPGVPSLRTMKTSSGASSVVATSNATGTPPRGSASTITSSRFAYCWSLAARVRPASRRSVNASRSLNMTAPDGPSRAVLLARGPPQMRLEPVDRQARHLLERTWLLEQMRRARHDLEQGRGAHLLHRFLVQLDNRGVIAADDEQRRRLHERQSAGCEIRTAAARDDGPRPPGPFRRGNQRRGCARACAEVADWQRPQIGLFDRPIGGGDHAAAETLDIEPELTGELVHRFLFAGEQIQQQRRETRIVQRLGHLPVACAEPAAAAAMGKDDEREGMFG